MSTAPEPPVPIEPPRGDGSAGVRGLVGAVREDRLRAALFDEPVKERRIGRYRVVGLLGRGGMGTVLEAVDDALQRRVALKLLHQDVPEREQGRLLHEARALARLSHPHVVQVHEVAEQPRPFIAMELVRGRTLAEWQRERPPWRACVQAYLQAGRGLAAAHAQRLVHRDFKPGNCMIDDEGRVRVMDFGLARALDPHERPEHARTEWLAAGLAEGEDGPAAVTEPGAVLGTLAYMSLEQLQGKAVDARSDQFAFCVALYEALYGERPFVGRTTAALELALRHERVQAPPRDARVPPALRRVLLRGLAADPAQRWPTMDELLAALERLVRPRWRGRLALAAVIGGLGLAGASAWHELTLRQACAGVADQLAGVWDQERRQVLGAALTGSPLPYAREAWEGVEPRLDAYAEVWVEASHDVCEEARVRREQPESVVALRTACLHERKVALREAVDVLSVAEPAAVERAVGLVAQLPDLERCADVPALLAAVPPPEDAETLAQVEALRDELIEARTLRSAARFDESLGLVEGVASTVASVDHPPLRAELALARGWALNGLGRTEEAVAAFEEAYTAATAAGHDAVAADAATMLSFVVGVRQVKQEVGLKWALTARAHAVRPAAEPGAEALALSNEATIHNYHGDFAKARASYERALELQEQAFGPDDVRLAFTLNGLAIVHLSLDELEAAAACHQRALALRRDHLGAHHPYVAMSLNNLGVVVDRQGRTAEALAYFREALAIKEAILGPDHMELMSSLNNLGGLQYRAHAHEEARVWFERAIAIVERAEGPRSVQLAAPLQNLGLVQLAQGQVAQAEATLLRALAFKEQAYGSVHPELMFTLVNLGEVKRRQGDVAAALRYLDRALAVAEAALPPGSQLQAEAMVVKAAVELDAGRAGVAVEGAERALRLLEQGGAPPQRTAAARLAWSRALAALDPPRDDEARRVAEEAIASLEPHVDPESTKLRGEIETWLGSLTRRDPPR